MTSAQKREVALFEADGFTVIDRDEERVTLRKVTVGSSGYSVALAHVFANGDRFSPRGQVFSGPVPEELR